jgi:hypothetical protein
MFLLPRPASYAAAMDHGCYDSPTLPKYDLLPHPFEVTFCRGEVYLGGTIILEDVHNRPRYIARADEIGTRKTKVERCGIHPSFPSFAFYIIPRLILE